MLTRWQQLKKHFMETFLDFVCRVCIMFGIFLTFVGSMLLYHYVCVLMEM